MSKFRWRSLSEGLAKGSTDGRYKDPLPNTDTTGVPSNRTATLKQRVGLSRLNGFDWTQGRATGPTDDE